MDQQALMERARRDDHDAFAELVRAAATRLDGAARLILRDPRLARDAVQETLIRQDPDDAERRDQSFGLHARSRRGPWSKVAWQSHPDLDWQRLGTD